MPKDTGKILYSHHIFERWCVLTLAAACVVPQFSGISLKLIAGAIVHTGFQVVSPSPCLG